MVKQPQHQRYIGRLSVYLRHPRDRDGHPLARVHPRGLNDEGHGGEGDPLHHLDARADDGPPAHQHVGPVPVEHARDDERLVGAASDHADVEAHFGRFSLYDEGQRMEFPNFYRITSV